MSGEMLKNLQVRSHIGFVTEKSSRVEIAPGKLGSRWSRSLLEVTRGMPRFLRPLHNPLHDLHRSRH